MAEPPRQVRSSRRLEYEWLTFAYLAFAVGSFLAGQLFNIGVFKNIGGTMIALAVVAVVVAIGVLVRDSVKQKR